MEVIVLIAYAPVNHGKIVMPGYDAPASIGRRVLSWYIDYLILTVIWALLTYSIGPILESGELILSLIVFAVLRGVWGLFLVSPGQLLLSIDLAGNVDSDIRNHESWLTLSLGFFFLIGGTQQMARWTQIDAAWPQFGFILGPVEHIAFSIVLGLVSIVAGCLVLRLWLAGQVLGIIVIAVYLVSAALSWRLWDEAVSHQVFARRMAQGLPVRHGETEFMQALFPEGLIAVLILAIVLLISTTRRFTMSVR